MFFRWLAVKSPSARLNLIVETLSPTSYNPARCRGCYPQLENHCLQPYCCTELCVFHSRSSRQGYMKDGLVYPVSRDAPFGLISCRFSSLATSLRAALPPLPVAWLSAPRAAWWKPNQVEKEEPWCGNKALQCSTSPPAFRAGGATLVSHSWRQSTLESRLDETCTCGVELKSTSKPPSTPR